MTKIKVALEWFINPDHLPFILGIELGEYKKAGINVELIEPKAHYDGFESLKNKDIDIHTNEPLHLFEHYFDGLKSLGCFFETRGGVMIKKSSVDKLKRNQKIKITTPASNDVTNKIGFEILSRYAKKENFKLDIENIEFIETDFYHLKNLTSEDSFDGAWLCFYNFEGIEAEYLSFDNIFIDHLISPYPNFSALELMTTSEILEEKKEAITKFISITEEMTEYCKKNPESSKELYYRYTDDEKSDLMDMIVKDTIPRLFNKITPNKTKWSDLYLFLEELQVVKLSDLEYESIW